MDEGRLGPDQRRRVEALRVARDVLTAAGLGSARVPSVDDLVSLAEWIVNGDQIVDLLDETPAVRFGYLGGVPATGSIEFAPEA